jgi:hypothetical protein
MISLRSSGYRMMHGLPMTLAALACLSIGTGARAQDGLSVDPTLDVSLRGIMSDLDLDEDEEIDSSGVGARAEAGIDFEAASGSSVRVEANASVFDYRDEDRETRESYGGAVEWTQELSEQWQLRLRASRSENLSLLEATSGDQTSTAARLQWEKGNDRVRVEADYRWREYDTSAQGKGDGYRLSAQYQRRFGSYHWLIIDARVEDMQSDDDPLRSYDRRVVRVKYSLPIERSMRLRVRPWIEYREWDYDSRFARGDPNGDLRSDRFFAPGVELAAGRDSRGAYARAGVEYRLRSSNDDRYGHDAIRASVTLGYRF